MKRGFLTALLGVWAALILPCCAHAQIYYDSEIYYDGYNVNGYAFVSDWEDGTYLYAYAELNDPNQARMSSDQNYGYYEASVSLSGSPTVSGSYSLYTDYWYFDDYRGNWYELGEDYNGVYVAAPPVVTSVTTSGSPWYGGGSYTFAINGSGFAGHSVTFSSTDPFESSSLSVASDSLIQGSVLVWSTWGLHTSIYIWIDGLALAAATFAVEPAQPPVCAYPFFLIQNGWGQDVGNGTLRMSYIFGSSSGNLQDVQRSGCEIREVLVQPGVLAPPDFAWYPPVPFPLADPQYNPYYQPGQSLNNTDGGLIDNHSLPGNVFRPPYYPYSAYDTDQVYQFRCSCYNSNQWNDMSDHLTISHVLQPPTYTVYKTNITPLDGWSSATLTPIQPPQ